MVSAMKQRGVTLLVVIVESASHPETMAQEEIRRRNVRKHENRKMFESIVVDIGGRVVNACNTTTGAMVFTMQNGLSTRPQETKYSLCLTDTYRIACLQWSPISKKSFPTLQKTVIPGDLLRNNNGASSSGSSSSSSSSSSSKFANGEVDPYQISIADYDALKPGIDRIYNAVSDPNHVVEKESVTDGYMYGGEYVPLTAQESMSLNTMPSTGINEDKHHFYKVSRKWSNSSFITTSQRIILNHCIYYYIIYSF